MTQDPGQNPYGGNWQESQPGYMPPPPGGGAWMPMMQPKTPGFAKAIGIISIVLASLKLLCIPITGILLAMVSSMANTEPEMRELQESLPQWYWNVLYVLLFVQFTIAGLLMVAGITTCQSKPVGRILHIVWAILQISVAVIDIATEASVDTSHLEQSPGEGMVGTVVNAIFNIGYPTIVLIVLGRASAGQQMRQAYELKSQAKMGGGMVLQQGYDPYRQQQQYHQPY